MKEERHSNTALLIAKSTRLAAWDSELLALVPPGAIEASGWFVSDHARDAALLQKPWFRALLSRLESCVLPGIRLHFAARKALIEANVRRAVARGARQVVVIGGGFDTLTYRLHGELPDVQFFELDHPATSASKRSSLTRHARLGSNLRLHAADLTKMPLRTALEAAGVQPALPSVVLAEGLLMYLPRETVRAFVAALGAFFRGESSVVLTFMLPDARGRARFHNGSGVLSAWLSVVGEPFLSAHAPEEFAELLGQHGFRAFEHWGEARLRHEVLPEPLRARPLAVGEQVCFARRAAG